MQAGRVPCPLQPEVVVPPHTPFVQLSPLQHSALVLH
jgi:hypothetical protein